MVVGGGPGGLNTAWVAAKRGHDVHVYEKRADLGGQLLPGSTPGHKKELRSLIRFQKKQIAIYGVKCHLNHEATAADITNINPDVVVLATGSKPALPRVEGIDNDIVLTYEDILNGAPPPFKKAVVVGGGPTGLELALYLAEYGCTIKLVEMLPKVGASLESMTKKILLQKLKEKKVKILTEACLSKINDNGVFIKEKEDMELYIETEKVIIAIGTRSDNSLYEKIKDLGYEVHQIGDCLEPRNAKAAIYDSAVLGRSI